MVDGGAASFRALYGHGDGRAGGAVPTAWQGAVRAGGAAVGCGSGRIAYATVDWPGAGLVADGLQGLINSVVLEKKNLCVYSVVCSLCFS